MKRLVIALMIISLFSLASAAEIKLSKESYAPGETLQAEIYGNFLEGINLENIIFYRERNIPVEYDILKLKDRYLLYALLPATEGNYTIKIKNTRYETETGESEADIIKTFSIKSVINETVLTINPGFVVAKDDFSIEVRANKNLDTNAEFLGEKQSLSLVQNNDEKVYFSVSDVKNYTETSIKIQGYIIPVFIFPEKSSGVEETAKFRFIPLGLEATLLNNVGYSFRVLLINFGNKNISSIRLYSNTSSPDLNVKITPSSIINLGPRETSFVNLTLGSEKKGIFYGKILASAENLSAELNFNLEVTENKSEVNYTSTTAYTEDKNCEELGGKFCGAEEACSIQPEFTADGYCCMGECAAEKKESSSSWIYGVILLVLVLGGLVFFSFYMKKKQKKSIDILKEKENSYKERMTGTGEEVHRSLTKE